MGGQSGKHGLRVAIGSRTMKRMWCWRCQTEVVMLDEGE